MFGVKHDFIACFQLYFYSSELLGKIAGRSLQQAPCHVHSHIVGLRVGENGKPLNDRFEHRRSKQITRELERKYNLHPAERKERAERPELKKVDYASGDVKHQIGNTVKAACYGYRFQSFGEYRALLANLQRVRRGGQVGNKRQTLSGHCLFRHGR